MGTQVFPQNSRKKLMMANPSYDQSTLLRSQLSLLNLAATLDGASPEESKEISAIALGEAERLKAWVDTAGR
jgi:hypothetical protein